MTNLEDKDIDSDKIIDDLDDDLDDDQWNDEEYVKLTKEEYEQMQNKIEKMKKKKDKGIKKSQEMAISMDMLEKTLEKRDFLAENPWADFEIVEAVAEKKWVSYTEAYSMMSWWSQWFVGKEKTNYSSDEMQNSLKEIAKRKWFFKDTQ